MESGEWESKKEKVKFKYMPDKIQNTNPKPQPTGEVLVRGADGKMYILRAGKLVSRENAAAAPSVREPESVARPPVAAMSSDGLDAILDTLDDAARQRVREAADAYARGVRDPMETRAALVRVIRLGGAGLTGVQADAVVAVLKRTPRATFKPAGEKNFARAVAPRLSAAGMASSSPRSSSGTELAGFIRRAMEQSRVSVSDPTLAKRFEMLVSARLRDVRDALETREILIRDRASGGMGLSPAEAERVGEILGGLSREFTALWQTREREQAEQWKRRQSDRLNAAAGFGKKDEEDLEKRHQNLLIRAGIPPQQSSRRASASPAPAPKSIQPVVPPKRPVSANAGLRAAVPFQKTPVIGRPMLPPPPPHEEMALPAVIPSKPFQKPSAAPRPVPARTYAAQPSYAVNRPKVQDVRFAPRLLGPIDELKEMKISDFRRLGRDAAETIFKLKAKIDLLAEESFSKKITGIDALKKSEPWRLYSLLSSQALETGKPVEEVIQEREKNKELTLTPDEFRAIMDMNKGLRF